MLGVGIRQQVIRIDGDTGTGKSAQSSWSPEQEDRHALVAKLGKVAAYEQVKASYNRSPNGADLLFLSRVCYGGVVRFRKADGFMSTPADRTVRCRRKTLRNALVSGQRALAVQSLFRRWRT